MFLNFRSRVVEVDGKKRGIGGKERIIHTSHTAAYDAKNRHGMDESVDATPEALAPIFAPVEPRLATPEVSLDLICASIQDEVNQYLVTIGWIKEGQTYRDLQAARQTQILSAPDRFLSAVSKGGAK